MLDNNQITLEQEILGAIFNNNELIIMARESIKPYMFQYTPHMKIYVAISDMVDRKMEVDLINFLEYQKRNLSDMDGSAYISSIYTCNLNNTGFYTKLDLLVRGYKRSIYLNMCNKISNGLTLEEIEEELENAKMYIHKCEVKKEIGIVNQYEKYMKLLYSDDRDKGLSSGLLYIDKYLGNFQKKRLITVFARSGVGKSTFALQVAGNMALSGANVFYGSAEMSVEQVLNKMAASSLSIDTKSIGDNRICNEDKDKICTYMNKLLSSNFYVSTETDLDKFIHEIKAYKLQNSLDIVFVDYINKYIDYAEKELMTNKLGKISGKLKELALEEDICVVLVAQANRSIDKKCGDIPVDKISASDIQDSARIEQDSDQVIGLYREFKFDDRAYRDFMFKKNKIDYYSMDADKNPNCINAIIMKNRHGERGTCALRWDGKYSRISNF